MAEVIWTDPAVSELDAIADYVALENPDAARQLVARVFGRVEQLADYPKGGSKPEELRGWRYRQVVVPPCRVFYRHEGNRVYILYVMRAEKVLRAGDLKSRDKPL